MRNTPTAAAVARTNAARAKATRIHSVVFPGIATPPLRRTRAGTPCCFKLRSRRTTVKRRDRPSCYWGIGVVPRARIGVTRLWGEANRTNGYLAESLTLLGSWGVAQPDS